MLSSTIGEVAAGRKMTFEGEGNDLLLSQRISRYRTTLGSAVRVEHDLVTQVMINTRSSATSRKPLGRKANSRSDS